MMLIRKDVRRKPQSSRKHPTALIALIKQLGASFVESYLSTSCTVNDFVLWTPPFGGKQILARRFCKFRSSLASN